METVRWWEKTVEHLYVRRVLPDAAFGIPLAGDVEAGIGDFITADHVGCTLIEFKKDRNTISSEMDKYPLTQVQRSIAGGHYAKAIQLLAPALFSMRGAQAHHLVFGACTPTETGRPLLHLRHRQYGDQLSLEGDELKQDQQLGRAKAEDLLAYMATLSKYRQKSLTDMGGLVFASVGGNAVCSMTLNEFVYAYARERDPTMTPPQPTPAPQRRRQGPSFG